MSEGREPFQGGTPLDLRKEEAHFRARLAEIAAGEQRRLRSRRALLALVVILGGGWLAFFLVSQVAARQARVAEARARQAEVAARAQLSASKHELDEVQARAAEAKAKQAALAAKARATEVQAQRAVAKLRAAEAGAQATERIRRERVRGSPPRPARRPVEPMASLRPMPVPSVVELPIVAAPPMAPPAVAEPPTAPVPAPSLGPPPAPTAETRDSGRTQEDVQGFLDAIISKESVAPSVPENTWEQVQRGIARMPAGVRKSAVISAIALARKRVPSAVKDEGPRRGLASPEWIMEVLQHYGVTVAPRPGQSLSEAMMATFRSVSSPRPGDLVFYRGGIGSLVVMYLGEGDPKGQGVAAGALDTANPGQVMDTANLNTADYPFRGYFDPY